MKVTPGSTDVTTYVSMVLASDGSDATGLTITDFDLQYVRSGATPAAKVDATALAATNSAHGDNQGIEIDATDQPGLYRFDWPDAAFAANVREVILTVKHASCRAAHLRVELETIQTGDTFARAGAPAGASIAADIAAVKSETAAIVADTNELQTDWANGGRLDLLIDAILADTNELQTDWANGGRLDLLIDAILADTNELQTDWVNGGRLDLLIDAIKAKTDLIPGTSDGLTYAQKLTLFAAVLLGKASGLETTEATYRAADDSKDRVVATVDADGNRTAVTLDAT